MEFTEIWDKICWAVISFAGSGALSAVIASLFAFVNNARQKKMIQTLQNLSQLETEKGIDKIKSITYKHDIQPLVESELKKVNEYSVEVLKKELELVRTQYAQLISIMECYSHLFDNSFVNQEIKDELQEKIEEAKNGVQTTEPVESEVVIVNEPEQVAEPQNSTQNNTKALR